MRPTGSRRKKNSSGISLEVVQGLRQLLHDQEDQTRQRLKATRGALVRVDERRGACPLCGGRMRVQKTVRRRARTLELGELRVIERTDVCALGCRHPSGTRVTHRSQTLAGRLLPGRGQGYDLMIWVGLQRFVEHRQRVEIKEALEREYDLRVSEGTITKLTHLFVDYLEALHIDRSPVLAAALAADGGWPLHADATGEDGRGTLLAAVAGWRPWVLGGWRIPTEREDQILPHLRTVCDRFGSPCAVCRDLGRAMIPAADALVKELGGDIPVLSCHFHFLKDIGKDLLGASYAELRGLIRKSRIRPRLRSIARDLGRALGTRLPDARQQLRGWLDHQPRSLPSGRTGLAMIRALAQWVLDYPAESENLRFPFDRPYLDLHRRARDARRALDDLHRRGDPADAPVRRALGRLMRALDPVTSNDEFRRVTQRLEERARLFDRLRDILRIAPDSKGQDLDQDELHEIQVALKRFRESLQTERLALGPAQDHQGIDIVEAHIERHGKTLWGHPIRLPDEAGGGVRLVARTNNELEGTFGGLKQGERRRSGRKNLARDLENLPASAILVVNLARPDYVRLLCGSLSELPRAFARLDAEKAAARNENALTLTADEKPPPIQSASLPREDRTFVRTEALHDYILAAARSRPPRGTVSAH